MSCEIINIRFMMDKFSSKLNDGTHVVRNLYSINDKPVKRSVTFLYYYYKT